jgi:type IV secretion system protein VirD4
MPKTHATQPATDPLQYFIPKSVSPQLIWGLSLSLVLLVVLAIFNSRRNILADGRFANWWELWKAQRKVRKQTEIRPHNEVSLRFGTDMRLGLPDLQPAIAVAGRSRSGKTASFIDPMINDAIEQGATCMVYDVKGSHLERHMATAIAHEYDPYVFAPGRAYSDGLNFLDFLKDHTDGKMANEAGRALNGNFGTQGSRSDSFFTPQGNALMKTVFMLAKAMPQPDLLMAWKILSLPELPSRLLAATRGKHSDAIDPELIQWAMEAATGTVSVASAHQTSGGIVGTAVTHFQQLIEASIIPCFMKSTIPLDLHGKQIIFFQPSMEAQESTTPLVAMAIHMLINRNLNNVVKRDRPLILFLDEFTTAYFPDIERWISLLAEFGFICVLGYQSGAQLNVRYEENRAISIVSSCGTKVYFAPGHMKTSQGCSDACGKKEVRYVEHSGGKPTWHRQAVDLMPAPRIDAMPVGECIIFSPVIGRPWHLKVRYKDGDRLVRRYARSQKTWNDDLSHKFTARAASRHDLDLRMALVNRAVTANGLLPTTKEVEASTQAAKEVEKVPV